MKVKVVLYPSEEGYAVCAPGLPGCWSQGTTREEALANIADAIRDYFDPEVKQLDAVEVQEIEVRVQYIVPLIPYDISSCPFQIHNGPLPGGEGWTAAGAFTSRGGPGEGVANTLPNL